MLVRFRREALLLFFGDIIAFGCALYLALFLRNLSAPGVEQMLEHSAPFSIIIAIWLLVFYILFLFSSLRRRRYFLSTSFFLLRSSISGAVEKMRLIKSIVIGAMMKKG